MKKVLLSFVTVCALIPCFAQPNNRQRRAAAPVPDCGLPIPAMIMVNPESQQVCPGSSVTFTSSAALAGGLHWSISTDNGLTWGYSIPNSTATPFEPDRGLDSLTIAGITPQMNGYLFRCEYASPCGPGVKTTAAALTVAAINPQISSQPQDVTACRSSTADFAVTVTGSSPTYQWQQSINDGNTFTNLPGKTNNTLTVDSLTLAMNGYQYRCIAGSSCASSVTSSAAVLTVRNESTTIVTQPASQDLCSADTAILSVVVQGNDLSYQWQDYYNVDIGGGTDATLRLTYMGGHHSYRCKITSTCKTIYSNTATLTYTITPNLLPAQVLPVCNGQQVYVTAITNYDEANPVLQWQASTDSGVTFVNIPNENLQYLAVTGSAAINGNRYRCYISNGCFTGYSNVHKVYTAFIGAAITLQPQNKEVCAGADVAFNTNATDGIPFSDYQWQVSTNNGVNFIDLDNALGNNLALPAVTTSMNNYQYRCKISGCSDTAYSNPAVLNVKPGPSLGNDTVVTITCDSCTTTDITHIFDTTGYPVITWSTSTPAEVSPGIYKLKVYNSTGCSDSAFINVNVHKMDTVEFCKNGIASFTSSISGSAYFWQIDWGFGYNGLHDTQGSYDNIISGSATPTLTITNFNFNGRVRCLVDNSVYSDTITFKMVNYWNGSVSNEWENPLNWNCGEVPGSDTEVIISGNAQRIPEISTDAACKKLFLKQNAAILIKPGKNLNVGVAN